MIFFFVQLNGHENEGLIVRRDWRADVPANVVNSQNELLNVLGV